ncbi:MAG: preprotein translocase subunit SecY, partial [Oscillospiraceae bacterium]|nr:preprotein translocase subunit SecY [Oscillospiraceae bacterium]
MWETLRNAWKVEELRKKLIYTFLMLLLFRLVGVIPAPGINAAVVQEVANNYDMLGLVNMMTGNAFSQMTIMAMGITPYINASIIMQLLTVAIPALERLQKDGGEEGKEKINRITRYVTVGLAALQAIGIIAGLQRSGNVLYPEYNNFFGYLTIGIIMAGGTALAMWIGERITKNGIGNGVSLLIFAG